MTILIFLGPWPRKNGQSLHLTAWVNILSLLIKNLTIKVCLNTEAEHHCNNTCRIEASRLWELFNSLAEGTGWASCSNGTMRQDKSSAFWFTPAYYYHEKQLVGKASYFSPTASCPTGSRRLWLLESRRRVKPSGSQREPCLRFRFAMMTPSRIINSIMTTATARR